MFIICLDGQLFGLVIWLGICSYGCLVS